MLRALAWGKCTSSILHHSGQASRRLTFVLMSKDDRNIGQVLMQQEAALVGHYAARERRNIVQMLFKHFLDLDRADLVLRMKEALDVETLQKLDNALSRLLKGEPVQYVLGRTEFYGKQFEVNENVLIPRPETEELVHLIIDEQERAPERILDIGTGSGCISISLADHFSNTEILATDISRQALKVAERNAKMNNVKVEFVQHDVLNKDLEALGSFDIIVSNPPYVAEEERKELAQHVLSHEPHLALFSSPEDPLIFYRRIAEKGRSVLNEGGRLYFELNSMYAEATAEILHGFGYSSVRIHKDMQGKERILSAWINAS